MKAIKIKRKIRGYSKLDVQESKNVRIPLTIMNVHFESMKIKIIIIVKKNFECFCYIRCFIWSIFTGRGRNFCSKSELNFPQICCSRNKLFD